MRKLKLKRSYKLVHSHTWGKLQMEDFSDNVVDHYNNAPQWIGPSCVHTPLQHEVIAPPNRWSLSVSLSFWIWVGHVVDVTLCEFWSLGLNRPYSFCSHDVGTLGLPCCEEIQSIPLEKERPCRREPWFISWQSAPISINVNEIVWDPPTPVKLSDNFSHRTTHRIFRIVRNNKPLHCRVLCYTSIYNWNKDQSPCF